MSKGVRWTEAEWSAHRAKAAARPAPVTVLEAKAKREKGSKLERLYVAGLELERKTMNVPGYDMIRPHGITLLLANDCRYTADVFVTRHSGELELHEVKGPHAWEDSIIKLKTAATMFKCFTFYLVTRIKGDWVIKKIEPV